MLFKDISIINENFEVEDHRYVGVRGERIELIADTMPEGDWGEIYNGEGKLLVPSFVDAHSHLPMVLMRGWAEGLPLMEWLQGCTFPFEAKMTADDIYWGTLFGIAEMLRFGIGSATEMYIMQDPLGRAFTEAQVKANFCLSTVWMGSEGFYDLPQYAEAVKSFEKYHLTENGRIRADFCLHAEYTSTEKIAKQVAETAAAHNAGLHVHVAETHGEVDLCRKRHQRRSPVKYLCDCGIFEVPTTAAHCVHLDDEDISILAEKNVTVATCPKSNLKLASGVAPITALLEAGVNVALGTDSVASNNNLNMIEEMRIFNLLQKGLDLDPTVVSPAQTLFAATRAGALSQQRDDCGLIKEGFKADLAVFDVDKVYMKPVYNLLNNLVYSAQGTDVVMTMVDGNVLYREGEYSTLDIERIEYEVEKRRRRIIGDLEQDTIPELQIK